MAVMQDYPLDLPGRSGNSGEFGVGLRSTRWKPDGNGRVIICPHGHAIASTVGTALQFGMVGSLYDIPRALAEAGYYVLGVDAGGGANWGGPLAMMRMSEAYAWATSISATVKGRPKVALMPWSMGGTAALNWIKRNPSLVAGAVMWSPVTDNEWAHGTGGYTPAYSTGGIVTSYASELDTAFNVTGTVTVKNAGPGSVVSTPSSLQLNQSVKTVGTYGTYQGVPQSGTCTINGVAVTYTGIGTTTLANDTLTGCTTTATATWSAGAGVTFPWSQNSAGYRIVDEYASWRGIGVPMSIIHASDDTAVPTGQTDAFVAGVADPLVTRWSPSPTGGHTGQFPNVSISALLAKFNSFNW